MTWTLRRERKVAAATKIARREKSRADAAEAQLSEANKKLAEKTGELVLYRAKLELARRGIIAP